MIRDGANISAWQKNLDTYQNREQNIQSQTYDVVIVGGGITGITTAFLLQKAGKKCLLAEAKNLCFGTTGGTTAHLNTLLDHSYYDIEKDFDGESAQLVLKATRSALDLVAKNVSKYQIDCNFSEKPGYLFSQDEKQSGELDDIYEASLRAGCDVEYSQTIPVPVDFEKAIVYKSQAQMHPVKYVYSLARIYESDGGHISQQCRVTGVEKMNDGLLEIETSRGKVKAHHVVYATHTPPGVNILHLRCAPYRSYAMAIILKEEQYPEGLAYDMYEPYHYYRTEEIDGQKYLIAGGEDHKTGEEKNAAERFNILESYLRHHYDIKEVAFKWSSQFFEPADGLPYIGHLPGNPDNVWVATGFGGNGITYSHVAAKMLTDLILTGESEYEDLFSPARVKPVAGFSSFVKENADVAVQLITSFFPKKQLKELDELKNNESKIVKYEGHSIALYKDKNGVLHSVNPACTHMKCDVAWNNTEEAWECPCHGSRFGMDGEMITAPARTDLKQINLNEISQEE